MGKGEGRYESADPLSPPLTRLQREKRGVGSKHKQSAAWTVWGRPIDVITFQIVLAFSSEVQYCDVIYLQYCAANVDIYSIYNSTLQARYRLP